jgi:ubiquinone/menaquinone biosynthesis C-methylase UbiE
MANLYRHLIRRAFYHFYREFAWTYDTVAWLVSAGLWNHWARTVLPHLHGRTLELGFGPGHLQLALATRPAVTGLDASPQMNALAARRMRRAGYQPRLTCGYAQDLPFPNAAFDTVVATFPADYILDPRTHAEVRRVLAPGGRLVVVPFARLAPGLYARLVDLAYMLTLQPSARHDTPAEPELAHLRLGDLALTPRWISIGPSRVMLLEGELISPAGHEQRPPATRSG